MNATRRLADNWINTLCDDDVDAVAWFAFHLWLARQRSPSKLPSGAALGEQFMRGLAIGGAQLSTRAAASAHVRRLTLGVEGR